MPIRKINGLKKLLSPVLHTFLILWQFEFKVTTVFALKCECRFDRPIQWYKAWIRLLTNLNYMHGIQACEKIKLIISKSEPQFSDLSKCPLSMAEVSAARWRQNYVVVWGNQVSTATYMRVAVSGLIKNTNRFH